jgi:hypothetical protein
VTVDLTVWVAVCWLALRALRRGDDHWWSPAGAVAGVGLLTLATNAASWPGHPNAAKP